MEQLGKPQHKWEGRRPSEWELSESNPWHSLRLHRGMERLASPRTPSGLRCYLGYAWFCWKGRMSTRHNFCGQQFQYRRINSCNVNKQRAEPRPKYCRARETINPQAAP